MTENKLNLDWAAVEKSLAEGTFSGYKMGILETEKLFNLVLKDKDIPGRDTEKQINYIERFLSQPDKLDYARNTCERIVHDPHFEISREETKHVISGYWQAMLDIEEAVESLGRWDKIIMRVRNKSLAIFRNVRNIGIGILAASAVIWFLGETLLGGKIASGIVVGNHFFIFKFLLWTIIIFASLLILGGILYFVTKKKNTY